jgi:hypothetical protein
VGTIWPRRSTRSSSAGRASPCSFKRGGFASQKNAAERDLTGIAVGRESWLFCGSDRGGRRAAADKNERHRSAGPAHRRPARISVHPVHRLDELLPWNWTSRQRSPLKLTMNVNKVHHVTTINRIAEDLGAHDEWLRDITNEMEIEDGTIWSMASENMASRPSRCEFRSKSPTDSR